MLVTRLVNVFRAMMAVGAVLFHSKNSDIFVQTQLIYVSRIII